MKQFLLLFVFGISFSQNQSDAYYIDVQGFRGTIFKHTQEVSHLATGHPNGFLVSINKKSSGKKEWQQVYGYPDYGISFQAIDFNNNYLGKNYAIGLHYNFYFLKRQLLFRVSQGIGFTTNPYDKESNNKNNAFGSKFLDNNYILLQYQKQNLLGPIGVQTGFMLTHFSNARFKAPNSGINSYSFTFGLNYNFEKDKPILKDSLPNSKSYAEKIKYNLAFRTGISEAPVVGIGQRQFYHIGLYADKRINRKSAIQLGTDVFFSRYLKDYIQFSSVAFPDKKPVDPNTDYKRIGVFVGHELFINKLSIETQFGYYVYKPFKYDIDIYQRLTLKYYITKNIFTGIGLKTHKAKAEAAELTLGIRL
jgi:hypothetical protein